MKFLVALMLFGCTAFASAGDPLQGEAAATSPPAASSLPAGDSSGLGSTPPAGLAMANSSLTPTNLDSDRPNERDRAAIEQASETLALGRMVSAAVDRQVLVSGIQSAVVGAVALVTLFATILLLRTLRQTSGLVAAARQSAMESRQASQQAIEHFVSDRRPWISVEAKAVSGIRWDTTGGRLTLCIAVKNLGQLPATNVAVHFDAVVEKAVADGDKMARLRRLMAEARSATTSPFPGAFILFPGQERDIPCDALIRLSDIVDGSCDGDLFSPYLIGCVSYRFAGSDEMHQTAFSYLPFKHSPSVPGSASTPLRISDGDLATGMVGFAIDYEGGIAT